LIALNGEINLRLFDLLPTHTHSIIHNFIFIAIRISQGLFNTLWG